MYLIPQMPHAKVNPTQKPTRKAKPQGLVPGCPRPRPIDDCRAASSPHNRNLCHDALCSQPWCLDMSHCSSQEARSRAMRAGFCLIWYNGDSMPQATLAGDAFGVTFGASFGADLAAFGASFGAALAARGGAFDGAAARPAANPAATGEV